MSGEHSTSSEYTDGTGRVKLPFEKSAKNITAWITSPLPEVGNRAGPLCSAPTSIDSASLPGCKSQTYTTWNCWNRSYIAGYVVKKSTVTSTPSKILSSSDGRPLLALPFSEIPEEFLDDLPCSIVTMLKDGRRWYSTCQNPKGKVYSAKELEGLAQSLAKQKLSDSTGEKHKAAFLSAMASTSTPDSTQLYPNLETECSLLTSDASGSRLQRSPKGSPPADGSDDGDWDKGDVDAPLPQAPGTSYQYGDIMPIRCFAVTNWPTKWNFPSDIPKSTMYKLMSERLSDHNSVGALGSITRAPSVRDATSIMALVKAMEQRPGSIYEQAALIRAGSVVCALDRWSYGRDPLPSQYIRRFKPSGQSSTIFIGTPGQSHKIPVLSMLAMTLDVFTSWALNKTIVDLPAAWGYNLLDTEITVVPINSTGLAQPWAMAYVTSFMTSGLWSGRINHTVNGTWTDNNWDLSAKGQVTLMPSCNSIYIPGATKVVLVLVDSSSAEAGNTIRVCPFAQVVPVVRGVGNRVVAPADFTEWWYNTYFVTANVDKIRGDYCWAWNHICERLGVHGACGSAASMLAEVYGNQRFGVGVDQSVTGAWKEEKKAWGAWAFEGGFADRRKEGFIRCDSWPDKLTPGDNALVREMTTGFNFASISPLHVLPTGFVKTKFDVTLTENGLKTATIPTKILVFWSTTEPAFYIPGYTCSSMGAFYRVGTYVGLLDVHQGNYTVSNPDGLCSFIHMLSGALGMSQSIFLGTNDIVMKNWMGLDLRASQMRATETITRLKESISSGFLVHSEVHSMISASTGDWDWDKMSAYYGGCHVDIENMFGAFSPWPIHAVRQWINKLGLMDGTLSRSLSHYVADLATTDGEIDTVFEGLKLTHEAGCYKFLIAGSIDLQRYKPVLIYRQNMYECAAVRVWAEAWQHLSQQYVGASGDPQYWETLVCTYSVQDYMYRSDRCNDLLVLNTKYICPTESDYELRVSSIRYPDPPSLQDFLGWAKAYILEPAWSGLTSYFSGSNVLNSVLDAGKKVVENYRSRNPEETPKPKETEQQRAWAKAEEARASAQPPQLPSDLTPDPAQAVEDISHLPANE